MTAHLIVTDEGATRVITLRRPEKKNAITQDMYRVMGDATDTAQNNPAIRCLIITGGPGVFTAGNDLDDFGKEGTSNTDTAHSANSPISANTANSAHSAIKYLDALAYHAQPSLDAVYG